MEQIQVLDEPRDPRVREFLGKNGEKTTQPESEQTFGSLEKANPKEQLLKINAEASGQATLSSDGLDLKLAVSTAGKLSWATIKSIILFWKCFIFFWKRSKGKGPDANF